MRVRPGCASFRYMHALPLLPPNAGPKSRPNCSTAFSQAVAMQQVLLADALKPETPPRERAQVACAWERLEERKRILRMKPKPKDVEVAAPASKCGRMLMHIAASEEPDVTPPAKAAPLPANGS